jgi:hypothetical protein
VAHILYRPTVCGRNCQYTNFISVAGTTKYIKYIVYMQYFIKQIAQSIINNNFSLMFLLHISTSIRSPSGRYIQRHTGTKNVVKNVRVYVNIIL